MHISGSHGRLLATWLAAVLLLMLAPSAAAATFNFRQPFGAGRAPVAGARAQTPTPQALASALQEATGLEPSQVQTADVCAPAKPGMARCAAQTVVLRSNHRPVRPHIGARHSFTQVFPTGRSAIPTVAPAAGTSSAPQADTPAWLQQAYDLTYLSQTAAVADTVAIVDAYDDPRAESDLATYRSKYGLPACTTANGCFRKVNQNGQPSPLPAGDTGWEEEESLDLDAVSALCPNCRILLVEANSASIVDLDKAIAAAVSLGAKQVSNSWGLTWYVPVGGPYNYPGVSIIASTGDHGYPGSGQDNYPAANPGVTAAGGTSISAATGGSSARGFGESAWSLDSSGWGGSSGCDTQEAKPSYQADVGCSGRSYADISADANPSTGLVVYDSGNGGWLLMGGTSLSSPLIAAYEALTGVNGASPGWAYGVSAQLNDPVSGSTGTCAQAIFYICNAGVGYDGPTGVGSISGAITTGAPGIGGPSFGSGQNNTYTQSVSANSASLAGGVYPNGLSTTYYWQYGTTSSYGQQSASVNVGSGRAAVMAPATLSGLSVGTYHYRLVASNSAGITYGYDYTLTTGSAGSTPPVNGSLPQITGTAQRAQPLSVSTGTWSPTPSTYSYQWQRSADGASWSTIAGAWSSSYTPTAADEGYSLRATVTAVNAYGSTAAASPGTATVKADPPLSISAPVMTGTGQRAMTLSVTQGSWSGQGNVYAVQWQRSTDGGFTWTAIPGASAWSYTLTVADEGMRVRAFVSASNVDAIAGQPSGATYPVAPNPPANIEAPIVAGIAERSFTLNASVGTWTGPDNTYAYQWQHDAGQGYVDIAGASSASYTLRTDDEGSTVRVVIAASNPDATIVEASQPTATVKAAIPVNLDPPSITGIAQRAATLSASMGTWAGDQNLYTYQWQRSTNSGASWSNITGATDLTYSPALSDEGSLIRIAVKASNPDGSLTAQSQPSAVVQAAPPLHTTAPSVIGTAQRSFTLTASAGSWSGNGNSYTYQWQRSTDGSTWTNIAGATTLTYALGVAEEGSKLRMLVTASNPDGTLTAPSAATATVLGAPPQVTSVPAVSGTAQRSFTLTATPGLWSGIGNSYTYQWQRSTDGSTWTNIAGATTLTYTLVVTDEGSRVRMLVSASNPDGTLTAASTPSAAVLGAPPQVTSAPAVSGTAQRSFTLTATPGLWSGIGNSYTYQWQRSPDGSTWTNIAGATTLTYTLGVTDEGSRVRMLVSASNPDGTLTAASTPSAAVLGAPPQVTTAPTVSGTVQRASTLTGAGGSWDGIGNSYAYQWQRSPDGSTWTNIAGAANLTYTLGVTDEGNRVRMLVSASNPDGTATAASSPTAVVQSSPPLATTAPSVTGTAQRTFTLTGDPGAWSGIANSYAYQWQHSFDGGVSWTAITGATGLTYTLGVADEGTKLRLEVNASNADGAATARSAPTGVVAGAPPQNTAAPALTGTPQRDSALTATAGSWFGLGNSYAYQWQRSTDGVTWTSIQDATGLTYTAGVGDEGSRLRMLVTASNPDGTLSVPSAPTATVQAAPPLNTTAPSVIGTAQRTFTLTATQGAWSGIGNSYSYQWQQSTDGGSTWTAIAGATDTTYTLGVADEASRLRMLVTASNPDGTLSVPSAPTATVQAAPPLNTIAPGLTGTAQRSFTLTATPGSWDGIGNIYAYQWQRSTDQGATWTNVSGATSLTYTLGVGDEGSSLRMRVTASNPDGLVSAASARSTTVQGAPPINTTAPSVTGNPQRTFTLTGALGVWSGIGNAYAYQWQRSADQGATWTNIMGATAAGYTLTQADEGDNIRLSVTVSNPDATATAASAASPAVGAAPPINITLPAVSGPAPIRVGRTLTASPGQWTPAGASFTYAWQRGNAIAGYHDITDATDSGYTLTAADGGQSVRVIVTAVNVDGRTSATSSATGQVLHPPVNLTVPPAPSGTVQDTYALTAGPGTWDTPGASFTYAWLRCPADASQISSDCTQIATGSQYVLTASDIGHPIGVSVTAVSSGGISDTVSSTLSASVSGRPLQNVTPPSISGNPQIPNTLSANPGQWSVPLTSITYTWLRCAADGTSGCAPAAAGTGQFTLSAQDSGRTIVLVANAASPGRNAGAQSAPLTVQAQPLPQPSVTPSVSGAAVRDGTLTLSPGSWTNSPTSVTYRWQRCNPTGAACQDIPGQVALTYQLTKADEGSDITAVVTASNTSGPAQATARPIGPVAAAAPLATHPPVISGSAQQDATVHVGADTWQATAETTYTVAWERCDASGQGCQTIGGQSTRYYAATVADVGHTLVAVIYASGLDGTISSASAPSAPVVPAVPRWKTLPVLSAAPGRVGDQLSITPGSWSGTPVKSNIVQLERCTNVCVPDGSPNADSYTITDDDVGAILRVREIAANDGGQVTVWSARYVGPVMSADGAAAVIGVRPTAVRNSRGEALATAQLQTAPALSAHLSSARGRPSGTRTVVLHRAGKVTGTLKAWACPVALDRSGAPEPCTAKVTLHASTQIRLPASMSGRVRVVVVRRHGR